MPSLLERVRQWQRRELQELRRRKRLPQPDLFQETPTDNREEEEAAAQIRRRNNYGYDPHD